MTTSDPGDTARVTHATAWGCTVGIQGPQEFLDLTISALPPGWTTTGETHEARRWSVGPTDCGWTLFTGDGPMHHAPHPDLLARPLTDDLELWVAEHARSHLFVHAGVAVLDGRAIVIPGPSRAGKSTLVAALVRAGATYYSDEFAPIDADGLVHPYPRAAQQRPDSPAHGWEPPAPPSADAPPVPIALVAEITYRTGAASQLTVVSPAQGLMALLRNTVAARSRRTEALAVLPSAVDTAVCLVGARDDVEACAIDLLTRLSAPAEDSTHRAMAKGATLSAHA